MSPDEGGERGEEEGDGEGEGRERGQEIVGCVGSEEMRGSLDFPFDLLHSLRVRSR